jgi:hypothetical protein
VLAAELYKISGGGDNAMTHSRNPARGRCKEEDCELTGIPELAELMHEAADASKDLKRKPALVLGQSVFSHFALSLEKSIRREALADKQLVDKILSLSPDCTPEIAEKAWKLHDICLQTVTRQARLQFVFQCWFSSWAGLGSWDEWAVRHVLLRDDKIATAVVDLVKQLRPAIALGG